MIADSGWKLESHTSSPNIDVSTQISYYFARFANDLFINYHCVIESFQRRK